MNRKTWLEMFNFSGKTVVVTGGANGIGYGIVKRFAETGANVVIADVDEVSGKEKAVDIVREYGIACEFLKTDMSSEKSVKSLIDQVVDKFQTLDIFVNNAGIFPSVPVLEMDVELWETIQSVNLKGVFLGCREAGKVMIKQSSKGVIVNIASIDALHPSMVGLAGYDASKHGVWGFTKNFALEMSAYGIRVNAVAPGGVITEGVEVMTRGGIKAGSASEDVVGDFVAHVPMKRMAQPDEIATVVLFLASDAASYMTGSMVVADGGALLA